MRGGVGPHQPSHFSGAQQLMSEQLQRMQSQQAGDPLGWAPHPAAVMGQPSPAESVYSIPLQTNHLPQIISVNGLIKKYMGCIEWLRN